MDEPQRKALVRSARMLIRDAADRVRNPPFPGAAQPADRSGQVAVDQIFAGTGRVIADRPLALWTEVDTVADAFGRRFAERLQGTPSEGIVNDALLDLMEMVPPFDESDVYGWAAAMGAAEEAVRIVAEGRATPQRRAAPLALRQLIATSKEGFREALRTRLGL